MGVSRVCHWYFKKVNGFFKELQNYSPLLQPPTQPQKVLNYNFNNSLSLAQLSPACWLLSIFKKKYLENPIIPECLPITTPEAPSSRCLTSWKLQPTNTRTIVFILRPGVPTVAYLSYRQARSPWWSLSWGGSSLSWLSPSLASSFSCLATWYMTMSFTYRNRRKGD